MTLLGDGLRLAVGTLTVVPVPPPRQFGPPVAAVAMTLAPLAALPVTATGVAVVYAGDALALPPLLIATLAIAGLALASGGLHLDGLADTADGLAVPGDRQRRLEVMRRGDVGPVGATALVFVLVAQVAALAGVLAASGATTAATTLVLAVTASRAGLALACLRGVPAARAEGLGTGVAGSVPPLAAVAVGALVLAAAAVCDGWHGAAAVLAALTASAVVVARAHRTVGGVTGDVLGACVEVALTAYLVVAISNPGA